MKRTELFERGLRAAAIAVFAVTLWASAALCAVRAWREFALETAVRGNVCGGLFDGAFALGACWHCYGAAAAALFIGGAALIAQPRRLLVKP